MAFVLFMVRVWDGIWWWVDQGFGMVIPRPIHMGSDCREVLVLIEDDK